MAATDTRKSIESLPLPSGIAPAAIFCVAFALRFAFLLEMRDAPTRDYADLPWQQWFILDSAYYHQLGTSILRDGLLAPTAHFLSPLYCYFIALVYAAFGVDLDAVRLVQCALGSLSCVLLYWIGRSLFSQAVGVLSGLCFAIYGLHVYYTETILPTVLVVFLNLTFLLLVSVEPRRFTLKRAAGAGVVLGLAALAKANSLLLVPATLALIGWQHRGEGFRRIAELATAFAIGAAVAIAPITLHNYIASGEFVLITTTAGRNLLKGNGPGASGSHTTLDPALSGEQIKFYLEGGVKPEHAARESREMVAYTLRYMADHPVASAKLFVKKALLFLNQRELFIRDNFYFAKRYSRVLSLPFPGFGLIGVLGLAGAIWGIRRWELAPHLYAMSLVQLASYTLVFVLARYRLVAVACLILFASRFLEDLVAIAVARRRGALAVAVALTLAGALIVNIRFAEFPYDRGFREMALRIERIQSERRGGTPARPMEDASPEPRDSR